MKYVWQNIVNNQDVQDSIKDLYRTYGGEVYYWDDNSDTEDIGFFIMVQQLFLILNVSFNLVDRKYIGKVNWNSNTLEYYLHLEVVNISSSIDLYCPNTDALKFKNKDGSNTLIYEGWLQSGDFYFHDVGYGMDACKTYLWNNKTLDSKIHEQINYLKDTVDIKSGRAQYQSNFTIEDKISSDGRKISGDDLRLSGVTKTPIPDYRISSDVDEMYFEVLNFPLNRVDMTEEDKKQGQFSFQSGFQQDNTNEKVNPKYFGATPQIYPEVVFNTTWSFDLDNSKKLNTHRITYINDLLLSVDGITYDLHNDDEVVFYVRKQGEYTSNLEPTTDNPILPFAENFELVNDSTTSSIKFESIKTYLADRNIELSFTANENYVGYFEQSSSNKSLHQKIIKTYANNNDSNPIIMPIITGASYSLSEDKEIITSIGKYNYTRDNKGKIVTVSPIPDSVATLKNMCTIDNLQYIGNNDHFYTDSGTPAYIYQPEHVSGTIDTYKHKIDFFNVCSWIVGSFPFEIGYFKDTYDYDPGASFDARIQVTVDKLDYKYQQMYIQGNQGQYKYEQTVTAKIGYKDQIEVNTFALAIVIWRNGKLVNDDEPTDDEPILPGGGGIVVRPIE